MGAATCYVVCGRRGHNPLENLQFAMCSVRGKCVVCGIGGWAAENYNGAGSWRWRWEMGMSGWVGGCIIAAWPHMIAINVLGIIVVNIAVCHIACIAISAHRVAITQPYPHTVLKSHTALSTHCIWGCMHDCNMVCGYACACDCNTMCGQDCVRDCRIVCGQCCVCDCNTVCG